MTKINTLSANGNITTLADIKPLLPAIYSPSSAEAMGSTLDRAVRLTGSSSLSQIPAEVVAWEEIAARIVWTGKFSSATPAKAKRDFDKFVARVSAIIRRAHQFAGPAAPVPVGIHAHWDAVAAYVAAHVGLVDADGKQLINGMSGVSLANLRARIGDVPPWEVTTEVARNALISAPPDKRDSLRRSVRWFNGLIRTREMHAQITALLPTESIGTMPIIRDAALDWSCFGPGFLASRDAAIEAAMRPEPRRRGADRFGGRLGRPALGGAASGGARRRRRRVENKTVLWRGAQ
jgi:hypothetical protein